jgi:phosphoribosylformimino-5-aminoimidazole carboxamide ribotide isomerase
MFVIGVIDLLNGRAVHARRGERHDYRPIVLPGVPGGDPARLADFYVNQLGLASVYVADLNAIAGEVAQVDCIRQVSTVAPAVWLDAGVSTPEAAARARAAGATRIVIGLETLASRRALDDVCASCDPDEVVLSLDLRNGRIVTGGAFPPHTAPHIIATEAAAAGVRTIIVLDVARVGTGGGCDWQTIASVREAVPSAMLVAGGGVRDANDLKRLAAIGCNGALVATALLNGQLRPDPARAGAWMSGGADQDNPSVTRHVAD